jgi:hypothetical protein
MYCTSPNIRLPPVFFSIAKMIKAKGKKVKISLLQAVEAHRVARGQGSHIT